MPLTTIPLLAYPLQYSRAWKADHVFLESGTDIVVPVMVFRLNVRPALDDLSPDHDQHLNLFISPGLNHAYMLAIGSGAPRVILERHLTVDSPGKASADAVVSRGWL